MEKKVKQDRTTENEPLVEPVISQQEVTLVRSQSSVQIETDSKGIKKYSVKVYSDDPNEAADLALSISRKVEYELNQ